MRRKKAEEEEIRDKKETDNGACRGEGIVRIEEEEGED